MGIHHPDAFQRRNGLAVAYWSAGRISEATTLLEANLADRKRVLGLDHPDTVISRTNLADAYRKTGRAAEAEVLEGGD